MSSSWSCTRRALYNVFIVPQLPARNDSRPPNVLQRRFKRYTRSPPQARTQQQAAFLQRYGVSGDKPLPAVNHPFESMRNANQRFTQPLKNGPPLPPLPPRAQRPYDVPYDEEIRESWIALVDRTGVYHPRVSLGDAMRGLNRSAEHLLQLTPADPASGKLSTCKVFTKAQLKDAQSAKTKAAKDARTKVAGSKVLEINWAIAGGDLGVKTAQLQQFLSEGRKVEMILARKKRARTASQEECQTVLKKIKESVASVPGATEEKSEGRVGDKMTLVFEGKKTMVKREEGREDG